MKPYIGITMGDAAGIGPEIILKALSDSVCYEWCNPLVIGSVDVMQKMIHLFGYPLQVHAVDDPKEGLYIHGTVDMLDVYKIESDEIFFGVENPEYGEAAVKYTMKAGELCMEGSLQAMVSAPLNKASMRMAGFHYEGQTQILGELTQSDNYGMILLLNDIRIMMYSTHMSLEDACKKVKRNEVLNKIKLADAGLELFDLPEKKIAVAALNPHAGENGLFGLQEVNEISPAVKDAIGLGINVVGPIPADTVFLKAKQKEFDLVIAMYHDQANIAMKLLGFGEVVTLLTGLPIIRTSTGHGTAFDVAGKNVADPTNLIEAIKCASDLGENNL